MKNKYFYISSVFIFFNILVLKTNAEFSELNYCQQKLNVKPHILESSDGEYRFIQLPDGIPELKINNVVYTRSGLYSTTGTSDPIWTIKEYFNVSAISNDGTFVVGSFAATSSDLSREMGNGNGGLKFYKSGKLIKRYGVGQLVDNLEKIPATTDRFHFPWMKKPKFDPEKNLLYVETLDYNLYVFDITTGEIIGAQSNWRNYGATVVKPDGEQLDFDKLHTCNANSIDNEYLITGLINKPQKSDKSGQQVTELTIPFYEIAHVENISQQGGQVTNVLLHLHNGDSIQMDATYYTLCGRPSGASRGRMGLLMIDIASITDLHEIENYDRASLAYPEISNELLEYYHKEDNKVSNWNELSNENNLSFVVSVDDYCEEILIDKRNIR